MNQETTYIIRSKLNGYVWRFKYHLNGSFKSFEILEGELNASQVLWLFGGKKQDKFQEGHFPIVESTIKVWQSKLKDNFEITIELPDISFNALWNLHDVKVKKVQAEKAYNKLKESDIIKCFLTASPYDRYVQRKGIAKCHLSTFINQRYFEDDWKNAK
ncbi:hypothetical protein FIA58_013935 [Flavobacterium jejuense]|uniref:Uncharacterized protein n=1 Tax=Flavobacterium jejuense TaxID=1544455 RepID=A0ABX0ITC3_9FLAO|nr:hypothetical protein [Flavobacterium jejuense]NHN26781.1 hypothetical protein [Flavobacterium jejuense]